MIVRAIDLTVKPEAVAEFTRASLANHRGSIREPGVLRFDVLEDEEDPTRFLLYEVFRDEAAVQAHRETPHYNAWAQAVEPLLAAPRARRSFRVHAPAAEADW